MCVCIGCNGEPRLAGKHLMVWSQVLDEGAINNEAIGAELAMDDEMDAFIGPQSQGSGEANSQA